jgi:protein-S-isoprenylcysteine O-methyltransferase Ste14
VARSRGTWFVAAQLVLFVAIALAPAVQRTDIPRLAILGVVLAALGVGLCVWAVRSLGDAMTAFPEPLPNAPLATAGPYRHVRHPIYTGVIAVALGWSLATSSLLGAALTAVLALLLDAKARYEERLLARRADYIAYRATTPRRFLPRLY